MFRRHVKRWGIVTLLLPPTMAGGLTSVAAQDQSRAVQVDLRTQLERGLLARRDVEFEFLQLVVAKVESGELPRKLVQQSFLWARKRPARRVQYFEQSLRRRARQARIAFDTDGLSTLR